MRNLNSQRAAQVLVSMTLVVIGIALALGASVLASLTDVSDWRFLGYSGVLVQVIGWARYSRIRRGGAA